MAFGNGPSIVTNGLVFSIDAADRNSYPGSGTSWFDLSGNGNTCTLNNGPTFTTLNRGGIVFDGTNDGLSCANLLPNSSNYTFEIAFSPSAYQYMQIDLGPINFKWRIVSEFPYWNFWTSGGAPQSTFYTTRPSLNVPTLFVASYDGSNRRVGLNGIYEVTTAGTFTTRAPNTTTIAATTGEVVFGSIFYIRAYNRGLTATEILQNYNATKTRFGL
jgi:hypothetical protein